ncbi:MAG TPA: response regulator transcription factor [Candidatus Binatia bacterium]|nr:response regulator transcription factor [Candidatus Binatia bacterium]
MNNSTAPGPLPVLAIDDEPQIQRLLTIALEANGYRVTAAGSGQEGLAQAAQHPHDLIILDLGLPDMTGLQVLKQLREWTQAPVIIVTVQEGAAEKIEALDCGADDYVTKPFNTGELLARMRAALRRYHKTRFDEPIFHFGDVTADLATRVVTVKGQPVKLTAKEYDLLRLFIQHSGKVLTHRQILREIWGATHEDQTQYLRVYMARLREKLEQDPAAPPLFLTEAGVGYRLAEG